MPIGDLKIAFHIGLHKTGTTFMQNSVFPAWPGIRYLRFRNLEYFLRLEAHSTYLVSCEGLSGSTFASKAERLEAIRRLSEMFPQAKIVISFRRHGDYLASLYSQYLRYGGKEAFDGFFSLDEGREAHLKPHDVRFGDLIRQARDSFGAPPFVYTSDDIRDRLAETIDDLSAFLGVAPPRASPADGPKNPGLKRGSARLLRSINRRTQCRFSADGRNRPYPTLARFGMDPPTLLTRWGSWIDRNPIVDKEQSRAISSYFEEDWLRVLECRALYCRKRSG